MPRRAAAGITAVQTVLDGAGAAPLTQGPVTIHLEPLQTAEGLIDAGKDAYMPILSKLLGHRDPRIRCGVVQVLARLGGPQVRQMIEPLTRDGDANVRAAAVKALRQWP